MPVGTWMKGIVMRKNSIKNTRINMEVQRELSEIIRTEIKDPRVSSAMISIAKMARPQNPDLKYCKVYVSVLGSQEAAQAAIAGLKNAVGYIRRELAHRINLRNTPELTFVLDQSIEYGVNMSRLIDEVTKDLKDAESVEDSENREDPEN